MTPEDKELLYRADQEAAQITRAAEEQSLMEVLQARLENKEQAATVERLMAVAMRAGRVQASKAIATFAECLTVSQLRELKALYKEAGLTWADTCKLIGISHKTADRYLAIANDLSDEFVTNVRQIGLSIRTLESARQLPEDVRKRLTTGKVVDLQEVSKEELTEVIKDLAREHAKDLEAKEAELGLERKAGERATKKAKETQKLLDEVAQELADLRAGLPADDSEARAAIQNMEGKIIPMLVVLRYTSMEGRSTEAKARIIASLSLIEETAKWTANSLAAKAEGFEPDDERLGRHARMTADEIAASDGQTVPGF